MFVVYRADTVRLILPAASGSELSEALMDCTLEELNMCPRTMLIASVYSDADRSARVSQVHEATKAELTQRDVQQHKEKR